LFYAIVGRGECEAELRSFIDSSGLSSSAAVYTDLNDEALIKSYQQCDIFILPNRTIENDIEGFGMVLVEAQACGRPVIAGNSGGTAETMIVGKTGEIIDCSSPQSIVEGLLPILQDSRVEHFGESAVEHVKNSLDWEAHVKKAKALFGL
jgi:phosphatidyl-myo-inositol dimannoside synthase